MEPGKPVTDSEENNGWNSDVEKKKVSLMRVLVHAEDPTAKAASQHSRTLHSHKSLHLHMSPCLEVDDPTLRRFLRARDLDVEKASLLFLKYLKWRQVNVPNGYISKEEVRNEIAQNKIFMQGLDKKRRPIAVVFGGRHFSARRDIDEFKRFVVYSLDMICASMPQGQEKFVGIGDLERWGYSNCDIRAYIAALEIMQDRYPERLGKVFLIHVPYLFWTAWKVIYPFIDNNTKKKIIFVENKNLKETLLKDIDESQIPEIYGGKLPLIPIQDAEN